MILYAEIGTKKFTSFHKALSEKAQDGTLVYVLRHFVAVSKNSITAFLSGVPKITLTDVSVDKLFTDMTRWIFVSLWEVKPNITYI